MPIERKLAAIMFTDIAGYTALSAKDENKTLELLDKQEQILTPIIEEFNGTLHNRVGDGLLFTFPTVTNAIRCGIKIQEEANIDYDLNYTLYQLLEDTSYLETAYNQVQEKADNLEPDVAAKFLSYPIPKAIVEEWEKVK